MYVQDTYEQISTRIEKFQAELAACTPDTPPMYPKEGLSRAEELEQVIERQTEKLPSAPKADQSYTVFAAVTWTEVPTHVTGGQTYHRGVAMNPANGELTFYVRYLRRHGITNGGNTWHYRRVEDPNAKLSSDKWSRVAETDAAKWEGFDYVRVSATGADICRAHLEQGRTGYYVKGLFDGKRRSLARWH